ncbi:hypothetical protein HC928_13195 [bacterium]|nr:hypothetical protein [bacterium]
MFDALRQHYESLAMVPLRVECHLADDAVLSDPLHLDALLSYAVVHRETRGAMLPNNNDYIYIPLPLRSLWFSRQGVPLWASTDFEPEPGAVHSVRYWHRRGLEPHMSHKNLRPGIGPYKDRRTPMQTVGGVLYADAIGNPEEIAALLSLISAVGKKRVSAGAVSHWRVYEITSFALIDDHNRSRRPIPGAYFVEQGDFSLGGDYHLIGFSPPYWHAATRALCVPAGAACG